MFALYTYESLYLIAIILYSFLSGELSYYISGNNFSATGISNSLAVATIS